MIKVIQIILSIISLVIVPIGVSYTKMTIDISDTLKANHKENYIEAGDKVVIKQNTLIIEMDTMEAEYNNLENLEQNINNGSFINFNIIKGMGNFQMITEKYKISGDQYIYDVPQQTMVVRSMGNPSIYTSDSIQIIAQDRLELQRNANIVVIRGNPQITMLNNDTVINSGLVYGKINDKKEIEFIEAFDNIQLITDKLEATGDYLYFLLEDGYLTIEDNVLLIMGEKAIEGCKLIFNTTTQSANILPCETQETLTTSNITEENDINN